MRIHRTVNPLTRSAQQSASAFLHVSRTNLRGILLRSSYAPVTAPQRHHRFFFSTSNVANSNGNGASVPSAGDAATETASSEPRMAIAFTCTVEGCGERSAHHFSKRSYERGIVLIQCPKCKNRHLIADHLGWFKDSTEEGKLKTVEDLLRAKGEKVKRGSLDANGIVEYSE